MDYKNNISINRKYVFIKNPFFPLLVIGIIGIVLRLYYTPLDIPFLSDAFLYFSYANDLNVLDQFPKNYNFVNNGWPTLLGVIFNFSPSTELLELMNIQRITSVIISTLTIVPVYYLCRKFFSHHISLLGACIFIFEPRIIINSVLGITDPLYIFLIASSLALFFSKNKNYIFLSFACIALSILVRYEGVIWFFILSTIFFVYSKKEFNYKVILRYGIIISICVLIIFPMLQIRIDTMGSELISQRLQGSIEDVNIETSRDNQILSFISYLGNGLVNLFKYLAWVMMPYLGVFVPIGAILAFKTKDQKIKFLIFSIIVVLATSVLYAYSRGIQETRYLYPMYPIFSVFSLFLIEKILEKTNKKKIIASIIIIGILVSSIIYLEIKSIDLEHEKEALEIFKDVYSITNVINKFNYESGYLQSITFLEKTDPIIISTYDQNVKNIFYDEKLELNEFIKINFKDGLTHIVIDDSQNRPKFFKELMKNEESYNYLEKVYDSKELGFKYHVKVFKINMEKLQ